MNMNLLIATLLPIAALGASSVRRPVDRNRIEVSLIDMDAILPNHRATVPADESKRHYQASSDGSRGDSLIHNDLVQIMKSEAGEFPPPAVTRDDEWFPIETTYLRSTSHHHIDRRLIYGSAAGCKNPIADDMIGFVALETNEDAYFDHPRMSVPIRAGTFVRFMGNTAHRTIINKGSVHLLGPIDIKTFIGVEGTDCNDSNSNACGTCSEDDACRTCLRCSIETEVAPGVSICEAGCVYHKKSGKDGTRTTCMCIGCHATCAFEDLFLNDGVGNKNLPEVGNNGGCDNDFVLLPCIVRD